MIAAAMIYALAIATLLSLAALAVERLFAMRRRPRRHVWAATLLASLVVPCITLSTATPEVQYRSDPVHALPVEAPAARGSAVYASATIAPSLALRLPRGWPMWPVWDSLLLRLWLATSVVLALLASAAWLRLHRATRALPVREVDDLSVCIADDLGPAVFGALKPKLIIPCWLLNAPSSLRSAVVAHEQAHIEARDPLLAASALLLAVIAPWNIPLWWQLRKLRFAIEVDCDHRVIARGASPVAYGEALLAIGQHRNLIPVGAVALIEPISQLERRIHILMRDKPRASALSGATLLLLATGALASAAALDAPAFDGFRAPPFPVPDSASIAQQNARVTIALQKFVDEKYPQLLKGDFSGYPVVTVLFSPDGSVENSTYEMTAGSIRDRSYGIGHLEILGVPLEEEGYVQAETLPVSPGKEIFIRYGERKTPEDSYFYHYWPADTVDRESLDKQVLARYFPDVLEGTIAEGQLWIILDSEGRVLASGRDVVTAVPALDGGISSASTDSAIESLYPSLQTDRAQFHVLMDATSQPITDVNGRPASLYYVWLAPGASFPAATAVK